MIGKTSTGSRLVCALALAACAALGPAWVLSDPEVGTPDTRAIPYDQGGVDDVPSAAARIVNQVTSPVPGGCRYSFDIEVFETCWKPVYCLRIDQLGSSIVGPAAWPADWVAEQVPPTLSAAGSIVFSTSERPALPGDILRGFAVVSYAAEAALRWYPADAEGVLMGKVTRLDVGCSAAAGMTTWGGIKSDYR
jgi:hypothetical protein